MHAPTDLVRPDPALSPVGGLRHIAEPAAIATDGSGNRVFGVLISCVLDGVAYGVGRPVKATVSPPGDRRTGPTADYIAGILAYRTLTVTSFWVGTLSTSRRISTSPVQRASIGIRTLN